MRRECVIMTDQNQQARNMMGSMANEVYEASVGARALARAGANPQLKGIAHEIMFCDKFNIDPTHFLRGDHASLTKSVTAQMRDVIVRNAQGRVIGHAQLKDTVSTSGVAKTVRQIVEGKYSRTAVYGTEETATKVTEALAKTGKVTQKIRSSGISSGTTSRIADKALGRMPTMTALGAAARSGGVAGAAFGAGIEAVSSISDVLDGRKSVGDAAMDVVGAGVKGGITGAASGAAGSVAAGAAGTVISAAAGTSIGGALAATTGGTLVVAAAPVVIGLGAACAVGSVISWLFED